MRIPTEFWIALVIAAFAAFPPKYKMVIKDFLESLMLHPGLCGTKDCRKIAQLYASSMDRDVDPCVNFYKFSCGGRPWSGVRLLFPNNVMQVSRLAMLNNDMVDLRTAMLESPIADNDILPIQQAKKFYQSCMDTEARKARGIQTIVSLLESNGGWPMAMNIEDWDENSSSWQEIDENFARMGADNAFYDLNLITKEIRNHSIHHEIRQIRYIMLNAPRNDRLPKFTENYTEYQSILRPVVEAFISENQSNVSAEQLEEDILDLFAFELRLRKLINSSFGEVPYGIHLANFLHLWSTVTPLLENDSKNVNWHQVIERLFNNENINEIDTTWMLVDKQYYWSLPDEWALTDGRTIVNYIHWNFVSHTLNYSTREIRDKLHGVEPRSLSLARSQLCLQETEMTHAEVYWFAQNYFGRDSEEAAKKLAEEVRGELIHQIKTSNWLSDDGKAALKDKLGSTKILHGVQDWHRNQTAVENHYEGLIISGDYVANILSFRKYQKNHAVRTFFGREEPISWAKSPLEVGPTYDAKSNIVNIQAAYLQWPSFSTKLPNYINYAATGMVIGHELGHTVDQESTWLKRGKGSSILKTDMLDEIRRQFSCIRDHFSNYYRNKWKADQTLSEDVSDLIGIRSSLDAYKRWRRNKGSYYEELKLPGFEEFTDEQMFFLSFSQVWCGIRTPGSENHWSDVHSPADFRVNGGVANTPEFGTAFDCPLGSPMNPTAKCSVWTKSVPV